MKSMDCFCDELADPPVLKQSSVKRWLRCDSTDPRVVVIKRVMASLFVGATLSVTGLPSTAAADTIRPLRWNTGGAVWSTNQAAVDTFLKDGSITDRGLEGGLDRSGWTSEEVRQGLIKTYTVDLVGVSRFLYSGDGVTFLRNQTTSYVPYWSLSTYAVEALRSAIIKDARDGQISSAGIIANLPTDMRLADFCGTYTGAQTVCADGGCKGEVRCTSLLSWFVFLPACIQASLSADPVAQVRTTPAPAPAPATQFEARRQLR